MLRPLDQDLWIIDQPLRIAGLQIGTRTTVVRLGVGGLLVHSPGPLVGALAGEIRALGPVRAVVAPNAVHHLFLGAAARAFPEAQLLCAPGVEKKQPALQVTALGDRPDPLWAEDVDQVLVPGAPRLNEVALLHRKSRTLILTDLVFNMVHPPDWFTGLFMRFNRLDQTSTFGPTRIARTTFRDRTALRAGLDRILGWDFDRVIMAHGEVLERGGRDALQRGYAWLT